MRILELLLPKGAARDSSLSPRQLQELDALQQRMDSYVDKILDPNTSARGREFLKARLRDDYAEFKEQCSSLDDLAEGWQKTATSDKKAKGVSENPRSGMLTCDKCKKAFSRLGISKHRCVPVKGKISEAVTKLPLTTDDFDAVKRLMSNPIPAAVAPIYISEIIEDDEFNDQLLELENTNPGLDVRPLVVEWVKRVMPDQMYRFIPDNVTDMQRKGIMSPIHGYDPHQYKGTNDPITGDAYGRF